jgi:hypothetical protein
MCISVKLSSTPMTCKALTNISLSIPYGTTTCTEDSYKFLKNLLIISSWESQLSKPLTLAAALNTNGNLPIKQPMGRVYSEWSYCFHGPSPIPAVSPGVSLPYSTCRPGGAILPSITSTSPVDSAKLFAAGIPMKTR